MTETTFKTSIKINYDFAFIKPLQSYFENLADTVGANENEIFQLNLVLEETLAFIIEKFPDDRFENYIDVNFSLIENRIHIEMTNYGPPIHVNQIPNFDINDENTVTGLWYKLCKNLVDNIEFVNRKNNGWLITFTKRLDHVTYQKPVRTEELSEEQSKHLVARKAIPTDAPQLVDLAYHTYRYSNGIPDFYDMESLEKHIAEGLYDILVIESGEKIIGAISVKYSPHNPKSAEMGSAMVMPEYRKSTALMRIIRGMDQYHRENPRNMEVFESFLVTTHTLSQRSVSKVHHGYKPFSLSLGMIPRPEYKKIEEKIFSRESLLNCFHLCNKLSQEIIYTTSENEEIIKELIENSGNTIQTISREEEPHSDHSQMQSFRIETIKSAILSIDTFGKNWQADLRKEIFALSSTGIKAIVLSINSEKPLPHNLNTKLAEQNIIFSGLSILSLSEIKLRYMVIIEHIDFESIQVHDPIAKKLLHLMEENYNSVILKE